MVSAEMLTASYCQHKLLALSICALHDVMAIINGQPWQNSVFWKEPNSAEYAFTRKEHLKVHKHEIYLNFFFT
jgi:hypothetical protein